MALTRNNTWLELEHYLQLSIDSLNSPPVKILSHRCGKGRRESTGIINRILDRVTIAFGNAKAS